MPNTEYTYLVPQYLVPKDVAAGTKGQWKIPDVMARLSTRTTYRPSEQGLIREQLSNRFDTVSCPCRGHGLMFGDELAETY